jgi:hypothetical protein
MQFYFSNSLVSLTHNACDFAGNVCVRLCFCLKQFFQCPDDTLPMEECVWRNLGGSPADCAPHGEGRPPLGLSTTTRRGDGGASSKLVGFARINTAHSRLIPKHARETLNSSKEFAHDESTREVIALSK